MNISTNKKVNEFLIDLQSLSPALYTRVINIRSLFMNNDANLQEDIKYGGIVFVHAGELVGGIFSYKKHLSIEFSHGTDFDDKYGLLDGSGKHRRHLKIFSDEDVKDKQCAFYINQIQHS